MWRRPLTVALLPYKWGDGRHRVPAAVSLPFPFIPRCYSCESPTSRLPYVGVGNIRSCGSSWFCVCASLVNSWNCASKLVRRVNRMAALLPFGVPRIFRRSVERRGPSSCCLSLVQRGQASSTCRTVIALDPHSHRGLSTVGTPFPYRKALNPILPVRNCVRIELSAF